ncbi:hypothetical protein ACFPM3_17700 [Streptomyces coeruleoprunus]|uniref:Secreted protein n=1 Tax=Streptomyces coeruleoprunus TaxID=285563 RepID=A0ABV9XEW4_9ACTN
MRVTTRAKASSRRARLGAQLLGLGLTSALAVGFAAPASAQPLDPGSPSASGEQPIEVENNPNFGNIHTIDPEIDEFDCDVTVKIEAPPNEDLPEGTDPSGLITISNVSEDNQTFDFTVNGEFAAIGVIVKGGPNANLFDYRPEGIGSDQDLHAPLNEETNDPDDYYGLSHAEFCLVEDDYNGNGNGGNGNGMGAGA